MTRNYRELTRRAQGVWVPRWILVLVGFLLLLGLGFKIMKPSAVTVKRLDSPDGSRSARLVRSAYTREHFVLYSKEGWRWNTLYYSPAITNDLRFDYQERLIWSEDSRMLALLLHTNVVCVYDFETRETLRSGNWSEIFSITPNL